MGYATHGYLPNETEKEFIRKSYSDCSAFIAICGGFEAPRRAGLLEGKTATAPRAVLDTLRKENPETNWIEKRYAHDDKVWTTGTLLNGLDAMSAFARHTWPQKAPLVETLIAMGHWPTRDIDYKDTGNDMKL